jgi:hypothetical protein
MGYHVNTNPALGVFISNCPARHTEQFDIKKHRKNVQCGVGVFGTFSRLRLSLVMRWCFWRGYWEPWGSPSFLFGTP